MSKPLLQIEAWHRCHKIRGARMAPADGLLVLPRKCSITLLPDLLLVRIARLGHPELESQEQEQSLLMEMLLDWSDADVVIVVLPAA